MKSHGSLTAVGLLVAVLGCNPDDPSRSSHSDGGHPDGGGSARDDGGVSTEEGFLPCEGIRIQARQRARPMDVVWVIDDSPSMIGEALIVQRNMNAFTQRVAASAIDYHLIVITKKELVRIPDPLGSDPEHFLAVDFLVLSNNPLTLTLNLFPFYRSFLRDEASTHFVFVTDDDSEIGAGEFLPRMEALLGSTFTAHAIVSPPGSSHGLFDDGCTGPNGDAYHNGDEYWALADATGGQQHSICTDNWNAVFNALSVEMGERIPIPCELELPDPPDGMVFDPELVNVEFTHGGVTETVPRTPTDENCTPGKLLWHFDNAEAPTSILLCPDLCVLVSAEESASLDIQLGCEAVWIPEV